VVLDVTSKILGSSPLRGWPIWNIYVTNDNGYVLLVVTTSRSFPSSWLINEFITRLTCGSGTADPSGGPELTPGFSGMFFMLFCLFYFIIFCHTYLVIYLYNIYFHMFNNECKIMFYAYFKYVKIASSRHAITRTVWRYITKRQSEKK
jgi:hypothetical protein